MKLEDLTGKKFGKLTVESLADPFITRSGSRLTAWRCKCECGRGRIVRASYLKRGSVTHCGHCTPIMRIAERERLCRFCEYSEWREKEVRWVCSIGKDPSRVEKSCDGYYCGAHDKVSGLNNRQSKCIICGAPIYSHGTDTPIYCKEHRAYAEQDEQALNDIPNEILFALITSIFTRAREDYIYNADGQRRDAEIFFKGDWAQNLSIKGFDVNALFDILDEVTDELREDNRDTE